MKSIMKFIKNNFSNFKCMLNNEKRIIIKSNKVYTFKDGFGNTVKENAIITIDKLESYNIYNYRIRFAIVYLDDEIKEFKKVNDAINFINKLMLENF